MSEHDDSPGVVKAIVVLLIIIVMALATYRIGRTYDEVRDLQRRVGALEQRLK
jgi:hypothetical protein